MDKRIYKDSEKLAHLNRAAALVASGTDTIRGYLKAEGIPYATFYGWKRRLANHTGHDECTPLVALGRPERATIPMAGIVVDYCGARIEVIGEDALLALLRNLRAASNELA